MPRKFHRISGRRRLFLKSMMANCVRRGRIETTVPRAKEIKPLLERLVTFGKRQKVSDLRLLCAELPADAAEKLFYEWAPRFKDRKGGYLRIIKEARRRKRDGTPLAILEFV